MASILQSPVAFTGTSASDLLRPSSSVNGIPFSSLGRARLGPKKRHFSVVVKLRKVKKHDYPWPDNPDPNVKGGVLSHLSPFKPLKEKPKPVVLDFEKPLAELEKKIDDVREMANETGLDFSDQITLLEQKYQKALKELCKTLAPIQRVAIARHPNRPTFLDHVFNITDKFVELHGDRAGYDDPAIVTGIGSIDGKRYMFIGHQKGRNTKENIERNFGMPTPHGYRKALRMMYYADRHGFPIITFVDTPGAFADLRSEHLGQGEAIAHNLRTMFGLKVPIVSIVIGEGGSGGALAIACANKMLMLENAVFYVASPEACAAILWKDAKASPKAAKKLKITATNLCDLKIADGVIPEPLGGAHRDPEWTSEQIKKAISETMDELTAMDSETILKHRRHKYRNIGAFVEGVPVDPITKVSMKKKDLPVPKTPQEKEPVAGKTPTGEEPVSGKTPVVELEHEVEKVKQEMLKAYESSSKSSDVALKKMIEKLKREIDLEYSEAVKSVGFSDRFSMLQEEVLKVKTQDQSVNPELIDKIEKLKDEFNRILPSAPNYSSLKYKLDMLKELSMAKSVSEKNSEDENLKQELGKKLKEVMDRPDIKEKMEALKAASSAGDLDQESMAAMKKEIDLEVGNVLRSMGFNAEIIDLKAIELGEKIEGLKEETNKKIEDLVNSSDLKYMIGLLKLEVAKAGTRADAATKRKIEDLEQQIKLKLSAVINSSDLKGKHAELRAEFSGMVESNGVLDGSLKNEYSEEESPERGEFKVTESNGGLKNDNSEESSGHEPTVGISLGANSSFQ